MAGLQRFHAHGGGEPVRFPNGSTAHYGRTVHGSHLAYVRNCPCDRGITPRTVYVTGEADTFFSLPAAVRVHGRNVRGFLTREGFEGEDGFRFTPNRGEVVPQPPAPRYHVTTFDLACQGFERLRSPAEFILVAYPSHGWGWRALRSAWLEDMQACDRGEGFDYDAARAAVREFCNGLRRDWRGRNMRAMFGDFATTTEDAEGASAFLYVRDTKADAEG